MYRWLSDRECGNVGPRIYVYARPVVSTAVNPLSDTYFEFAIVAALLTRLESAPNDHNFPSAGASVFCDLTETDTPTSIAVNDQRVNFRRNSIIDKSSFGRAESTNSVFNVRKKTALAWINQISREI